MKGVCYLSQGRPKAPPATQNASQKSSGDKNKEVMGTKFKIVATRCHILRRKCTKFDFGWGSAPEPAGGAHSAPPDPLAGFKGPTSKGREGREGKGREGEEKEERGKEGKGEGCVMAFWGDGRP